MDEREGPDGGAPDTDNVVQVTPELEGEIAPVETRRDAGRPILGISPGIRYMAAGAFFFSLMSLLVKAAGERLPSQEIVLVRAVITVVMSYWAIRRASVGVWGHNRRLLLLRGVLGFVGLSGFYYAVVQLPLAEATVIHYTNPIWAALLAVPFLGENLRPLELLFVALSMMGLVLVTQPGFLFGTESETLDPLAVAIGLMGAVGAASAYIVVRHLRQTEHPMVIVYYFGAASVVGSLPLALPNLVWPTQTEWLTLLGVGITTQFGQVAITKGLRMEPATRATAIAYLQIVFAALWGALFFAEVPDLMTVIGGLLIVSSTIGIIRQAAQQRDSARS